MTGGRPRETPDADATFLWPQRQRDLAGRAGPPGQHEGRVSRETRPSL